MHAEEVSTVAARLESAAQAGTNQSRAQLVKDLSQAIERAIAQLRPLCAATGSSPVHGTSAVG
jgi:enamine deaminase RidA (YjgF/YER057c/UK114 family)